MGKRARRQLDLERRLSESGWDIHHVGRRESLMIYFKLIAGPIVLLACLFAAVAIAGWVSRL